ncbi:MAG: hypothetical protein HOI95_28975 [Chromatiales bacterium]|jgi:hypothetical protein|nr:hypothetical protein [Chromatiales bacterium]
MNKFIEQSVLEGKSSAEVFNAALVDKGYQYGRQRVGPSQVIDLYAFD